MTETSRARGLRAFLQPAIATAIALVVVLFSWLVVRYHGEPTPSAILFRGLMLGLTDALGAAAIILVYQTVRIINFAQLALGLGGAVLYFNFLYLESGIPFPIALVLGLAGGAVGGAIFHLGFGIRFARAPRLVLTLASIFAGEYLVLHAAPLMQTVPGFPDITRRDPNTVSGAEPLANHLPFAGHNFTIGSLPLPFGFGAVFTIVLSLALLGGLAVFLYRTRFGKAVRASAENGERAALLGISVGGVALLAWCVAGVLSAGAVMLRGSIETPGSLYNPPLELLIGPLTAAVLARMRSLWVAVVASIAYEVLDQALRFQNVELLPLFDAALFAALIIGLLVGGRRISRGDEGTSWEATRELRPIPRELAKLPIVRGTRIVALILGVGAVVGYPFFAGAGDQSLGSVFMLSGIVVISLVVLTGWSGQASAGQFAFVAIGALTGAVLASKAGFPFWLAVPAATVLTAGIGALLAFPALRVKGLFLLASTYAFAVMVRQLLFSDKFFPFLQTGTLNRPSFFFIDFDDERAMYFLCLGALILSIFVVVNLRRSRFGRTVIAVRENEANARSAGVGTVRTKVSAFALAGALCGFAGAIFVFQQHGVVADSYSVDQSLLVLEAVVIGGAASVSGGLLGLFFMTAVIRFLGSIAGTGYLIDILPLAILLISPGGLIAAATKGRDAILRIIAERRRIVVPSLFADIDPAALELQLIPLATSQPGEEVRERFDLGDSRYNRVRERLRAARSAADDSHALASAAHTDDDTAPTAATPELTPA